jgi:Skp family chaperone for outer membrane proteins
MPVINRVFKNASKIIQLRQSGNDDSIDRQKETFSKDLLNRFSTANEAIQWADYVMDTIVTQILDGTYEQIHQNKLQMQSDSVQAKIETEKQMKETKNKKASADAQKKDKQYQRDYQAWEKDRERFYAELEQYQNETATYAEQIRQFEQELDAYNQEKNIIKKYNKAVDKKYERFEDNLDYLEYVGTYEYDGTTYTFDKTKNALVDDPSNPQLYLYFKMSPDIDNFNIFPVSVRATNFDFNDTMPEPKASVYMTPTLTKPTKPKPPKPPKPMTGEPVRGAGLGRHINYDKDYWTNAKPHVMKPPDKKGGSLKQKMPPKRIINLLAKLGYLIV